MKDGKSVRFNLPPQDQNGHVAPFKFAKLLDPEATWDKVRSKVKFGNCSCQTESSETIDEKQDKSKDHWCHLPYYVLKDQLGDVLHWIRQITGLACGLLFGSIPLVGGIWIVLFLLISSGIIYGYYAMVLKVDEEDFGGHGALLQEGLFASITLFLLSWILIYSLAHF